MAAALPAQPIAARDHRRDVHRGLPRGLALDAELPTAPDPRVWSGPRALRPPSSSSPSGAASSRRSASATPGSPTRSASGRSISAPARRSTGCSARRHPTATRGPRSSSSPRARSVRVQNHFAGVGWPRLVAQLLDLASRRRSSPGRPATPRAAVRCWPRRTGWRRAGRAAEAQRFLARASRLDSRSADGAERRLRLAGVARRRALSRAAERRRVCSARRCAISAARRPCSRVPGSLACPSPEERAERARADAREALARGDRGAALGALEVLRELRAETSADPLELAQLLVQAGEAPQAVWLLEEAVRESPERDELRIALAQAALLVGDAAAARDALDPIGEDSEKHAERARASRAGRAPARRLRSGRGHARAGRTALSRPGRGPAGADRHVAARAPPRRGAARARRGAGAGGRRRAGRRVAPVRDRAPLRGGRARQTPTPRSPVCARSSRKSPTTRSAWQALAQVMLRAGRLEEVTKELKSALERDPEHAELLPILASLHRAGNRPEEARRALRELVERSPSPTAYLALARHHSAQAGRRGHARGVRRGARASSPTIRCSSARAPRRCSPPGRSSPRARRSATTQRASRTTPTRSTCARVSSWPTATPAAAAERLERLVPRLDRSWTQHWLGRALEAAGDRAGADRRYQLALLRDPARSRPLRAADRAGGAARRLARLGGAGAASSSPSHRASTRDGPRWSGGLVAAGRRGGGGERWRAAPRSSSPTARTPSCCSSGRCAPTANTTPRSRC